MKLSQRISQISPSLTLAITAKAKSLKKQGVDVVSFGAGEPDFDTPQHVKDKAIESIKSGFTKYTPASGIPELKQEIVKKFQRENGLAFTESEIVISCGAKHSLYNIFQVLLNDKNEVIIPAPYWLSYPEMVKLAGGKPVIVNTKQQNDFKMTPQDLKKCVSKKTRAVIINSPSNPTGTVYSKGELAALADIAVQHSFSIVSDEIYEHLVYDGKQHVSIATFSDEVKALTITVNGVSKSYAMTGWRIGYVAADAALVKAIGTLQSHSTSNPTSFAQIGALQALREGSRDIQKMHASFSRRRDLIMQELAKVSQLKPCKPYGAFYVFCDISATGLKAMDFATRILDEAQVAVIPGEPFGSPNHIRLSFAINDEAIKKGVGRIKEWVNKL